MIKLFAGVLVSGSLLAVVIANGKERMQQIEHLFRMQRTLPG